MLGFLGSLTATGAFGTLGGCCSALVNRQNVEKSVISELLFSETAIVGLGVDPIFLKHTLIGHPENHLRIQAILDQLIDDQTKKRLGALRLIPGRLALREELLLAHEDAYIDRIYGLRDSASFASTSKWSPYGGPFAYDAASTAAAVATDVLRAVDEGRISSGIALVRPPGHHAQRAQAAGYCFFNNVVIAARSLQKRKQRRIAIVDLDVHHGNGIQDAFYRDSHVLYISTHQDGWPGTGAADMIGSAQGRGTNINIPLPMGTGDKGFDQVFSEIIEPSLRRHRPDIIVGAVGFDTHWRDYQGGLSLSCYAQAELVLRLKRIADEVCNGRLALILEGGYQLEVLASGVSNAIQALALKKSASVFSPRDTYGPCSSIEPNIQSLVARLVKLHRLR